VESVELKLTLYQSLLLLCLYLMMDQLRHCKAKIYFNIMYYSTSINFICKISCSFLFSVNLIQSNFCKSNNRHQILSSNYFSIVALMKYFNWITLRKSLIEDHTTKVYQYLHLAMKMIHDLEEIAIQDWRGWDFRIPCRMRFYQWEGAGCVTRWSNSFLICFADISWWFFL